MDSSSSWSSSSSSSSSTSSSSSPSSTSTLSSSSSSSSTSSSRSSSSSSSQSSSSSSTISSSSSSSISSSSTSTLSSSSTSTLSSSSSSTSSKSSSSSSSPSSSSSITLSSSSSSSPSSSSSSSKSSSSSSSASSSSSSSVSSSSSSSSSQSSSSSSGPRGSWTVGDAVYQHWLDKGLNGDFRNAWGSDGETTSFLPFNDTEARPAKNTNGVGNAIHPTPYCIYEQDESIIVGNSGGKKANEERQIQDVPCQFTIYGSTKAQARDFAKKVAVAYDKCLLPIKIDSHIETFRDPDFCVRHDDRVWSWTLQYRFRIDCKYPTSEPRP